ncbi:MAG: hypothetical protein IJ330_03935 [Oscillospiraceae bacterium]|nr:hypothetical protein [Oscillospiraceae bacterium]
MGVVFRESPAKFTIAELFIRRNDFGLSQSYGVFYEITACVVLFGRTTFS